MKKIATLLKGDIKNIRRDALLLVNIIAPALLALFLRFGLPWISMLLLSRLQFDLTAHYPFILSFMALFTPFMMGALAGFILLDDRDSNILMYLSVTPLSKRGYLLYRTAAPSILSFFLTFAMLAFANLAPVNYVSLIPVVFMASTETPIAALFLGTFASNKVEGLALMKGLGILFFAPVAGYLIKSKLQLLAGIFPTYWVTQSFLASAQPGTGYWFYMLSGLAVHYLYFVYFLQRFKVKAG